MFSKYIILFVIYSVLGFLWESFFCLFQYGGWSRRGFLHGPLCPIYGFGALIVTVLVDKIPYLNINDSHYAIRIFIISCVGSAILEYVTATILEKVFHAAWWDYSMFPLNFQGKVCLFCTLGFGVAGIFIPKYLIPYIVSMVDSIPHILYEPIAFILIAIIASDLTLTISTLTDFVRKVDELDVSFNGKMENIVDGAKQKGINAKDGLLIRKEKYIDANIKKFTNTKDYLYKGAINRITGFKFKVNSGKNNFAIKIKNILNKN